MKITNKMILIIIYQKQCILEKENQIELNLIKVKFYKFKNAIICMEKCNYQLYHKMNIFGSQSKINSQKKNLNKKKQNIFRNINQNLI